MPVFQWLRRFREAILYLTPIAVRAEEVCQRQVTLGSQILKVQLETSAILREIQQINQRLATMEKAHGIEPPPVF
jgi:hypothetical protein